MILNLYIKVAWLIHDVFQIHVPGIPACSLGNLVRQGPIARCNLYNSKWPWFPKRRPHIIEVTREEGTEQPRVYCDTREIVTVVR